MSMWWPSHALSNPHIHSVTIICTQQHTDPVSYPHIHWTTIMMAPPWCSQRWPTSIFNWCKIWFTAKQKEKTQAINAVSSRFAFTEGLAAVERWKTKYNKSCSPSSINITLYTKMTGIAKIPDQLSKADPDIESLTLSLCHWFSVIESLTSSDMDLINRSLLTFMRPLPITLKTSWDWHTPWSYNMMMFVQCGDSSHADKESLEGPQPPPSKPYQVPQESQRPQSALLQNQKLHQALCQRSHQLLH